MRSLVAAFLLLALTSCAAGAALSWQLNKPTGSNIVQTFATTPINLWWGMAYEMKVTPLFSDLLDGNATNNNNTDLTYSFSSFPAALTFSPSTIKFRVTVQTGAADPVGAGDVIFSPEFQLVRFWAVNMSASFRDPIWNLNFSAPPIAVPANEPIAVSWNEECFLAGTSTPCTSMTSSLLQNITDVVEPVMRLLVLTPGQQTSSIPPSNQQTAFDLGSTPVLNVVPYLPSPPVIVNLPLEDGAATSFTEDRLLTGTTAGADVREFTPGRDNAGGNLTISVYSVWRTVQNDTGNFFEQIGLTTVTMIPSSVTIDANSPAAAFQFNADIPWDTVINGEAARILSYYVFFRVREASTSPSVIDDAGFPQGAFLMSSLLIAPDPVRFELLGADLMSGSAIPISPKKTGSYRFHVSIEHSPFDLGMGAAGTITYPFHVEPPGAFTILVATGSDDSTFAPVSSFVWTGSQRLIEFILNTQETPTDALRATWNFSDPTFSTPRSLSAFELLSDVYVFDIVSNDVMVSTTNQDGGRLEDGISPGQPFWMLFEWTPPTTNGFQVTVQATGLRYPDGTTSGNYSFAVGGNSTAFLEGPFFALDPTNLDSTVADVSVIPINIGLNSPSGNSSSDHTWFRVSTPHIITVRRDRAYIITNPSTRTLVAPPLDLKRASIILENAPYGIYELTAAGVESEQFCVGVSLTSRFFANDQQEVWVTLWSETLDTFTHTAPDFRNRSGLIFTVDPAPAPAAGVSRVGLPPSTLVLSRANNGTSCFTVAFDRNWPFLSSPLNDGSDMINLILQDYTNERAKAVLKNALGFWQVRASMGGPSSIVFERNNYGDSSLLRMPDYFVVRRPTIHWQILQSQEHEPTGEWDFEFLAGESALVYVSLNEPTLMSLNYAITCTACVLEQVDVPLVNGAPGFEAGSEGAHAWRISFTANPKPFGHLNKRASTVLYDTFTTVMHFWSFGADAAFFAQPPDVMLAVKPRSLTIQNILTATGGYAFVGLPGGPYSVSLDTPVLNDIALVPIQVGNSKALLFTPPQITFTADSPHTQYFTIAVDSSVAPYHLGPWQWHWSVSGTDANITLPNPGPMDTQTITFLRRPAPAIHTALPNEFVAGVTYGPLDVTLSVPLLVGEDEGLTVSAYSAEGFTMEPATLTFLPGQFQQTFSLRWDPVGDAALTNTPGLFWRLSGPHAWKYDPPEDPSPQYDRALRTVHLTMPDLIIGGTQTGWLRLDFPTPSSLAVTLAGDGLVFTPPTVQFTAAEGVLQYFTVAASTDAATATRALYPSDGEVLISHVSVTLSGPDVSYYQPFEPISVSRVHRSFVWDVNTASSNSLGVAGDTRRVFMLNHPSPLYTVTATTAPSSSVTVTLECDYLSFSPASMTFGPGVLTQSFSFTPIGIPATQIHSSNETTSDVSIVNVILSGPDADLFTADVISRAFTSIMILPEIDVSPISPIYTDGSSDGDIHVSIRDAGKLATGLPAEAGAYNGFTLHVKPAITSVYIEPSVVEFSSATTGALRSFSISHKFPSAFGTRTSYAMQYLIQFAGNLAYQSFDISDYVPMHARQVLLKRYNIVPQFPKVLSYGWQEASFNLTRPSEGSIALIPVMPILDGQDPIRYGSHATAGGRVQFEPAEIVFAPGQMVQSFLVKAQRGVERGAEALYYRVEWQLVGHENDLYNFIEYVAPRNDDVYATHFSTWHVADTTTLHFGTALAIILICMLLML